MESEIQKLKVTVSDKFEELDEYLSLQKKEIQSQILDHSIGPKTQIIIENLENQQKNSIDNPGPAGVGGGEKEAIITSELKDVLKDLQEHHKLAKKWEDTHYKIEAKFYEMDSKIDLNVKNINQVKEHPLFEQIKDQIIKLKTRLDNIKSKDKQVELAKSEILRKEILDDLKQRVKGFKELMNSTNIRMNTLEQRMVVAKETQMDFTIKMFKIEKESSKQLKAAQNKLKEITERIDLVETFRKNQLTRIKSKLKVVDVLFKKKDNSQNLEKYLEFSKNETIKIIQDEAKVIQRDFKAYIEQKSIKKLTSIKSPNKTTTEKMDAIAWFAWHSEAIGASFIKRVIDECYKLYREEGKSSTSIFVLQNDSELIYHLRELINFSLLKNNFIKLLDCLKILEIGLLSKTNRPKAIILQVFKPLIEVVKSTKKMDNHKTIALSCISLMVGGSNDALQVLAYGGFRKFLAFSLENSIEKDSRYYRSVFRMMNLSFQGQESDGLLMDNDMLVVKLLLLAQNIKIDLDVVKYYIKVFEAFVKCTHLYNFLGDHSNLIPFMKLFSNENNQFPIR